MHARTRCAVLVLSGLLVVAACNDDDDGDGAAIASSDTAGAAAVAEAVETTAPSVDRTDRPVDTFEPPVTTTAPSGAVLFGGDDFYAVPEPLPAGEPGTLLRYEPIECSVAGPTSVTRPASSASRPWARSAARS